MKAYKRIILPSFLLLVLALSFTVVYASISTSMLISGGATVKAATTYISSVTYVSSTGNASYNTPTYTDTSFTLPVTLAPGESITFNVGVVNTSGDDYEVTQMNVDTFGLTYLYQGDTCFLGDRVHEKTSNTCAVTLTNETSNTINATYVTTYEYTVFTDYSLAHRLETLTHGVSSGLVHDLVDDTEYINRYAYTGTNPYNYVLINGEVWRIMGLYFNITGGTKGTTRVKIVKDVPEVTSTWNQVTNDWATSTLASSLESYYTSNLIESALWYYGSTNYNYNQSSTDELESQLMSGTTAGNYGCGTFSFLSNSCRTGTFSTSTTQNIGLLSPAEYAQTTGGGTIGREACLKSSLYDGQGWAGGTCNDDSWLFNSTKLTGVEWTIQPMYRSNYANYVTVINRNKIDRGTVTSSYLVRPAAYLKADVVYISGNGSSTSPYVVAESGSHHNHVVTFDANGGSGFMNNQIVMNNTSTALNANTYTREGYTFLGWSTNRNAQTALYRDEESIVLTQNLNLYAIWSARSTFYSEIVNLSSGNTVNTFSSSSDDGGGSNSIYYYSGSASTNNVIFGGYCWKIFRTTSTGGVKMIYNGAPENDECSSSPGIGQSAFNTTTLPEGVGFMYEAGNITGNTTSSTAKTTLDTWVTNYFINYTYYLEDTPYCNDRSTNTSYTTSGEIRFNRYDMTSVNLTCTNQRDRFTVSNTVGNSALTYPVGLITADELYLAGITGTAADTSNYLYTGNPYWTMTPKVFKLSNGNYENRIWRIDATTPVMDEARSDSNNKYIRPVVTLNNSVILDSGTGSLADPYVVIAPAVAPLTVTYNANGGTGTMNPTPISSGKGFILSTNTFTRDGYHFVGWSREQNGIVEYADGATASFTSSTTLYAIWERNVIDYDYTGNVQTFSSAKGGIYKLEAWGAQGGSYSGTNGTFIGGYGAYATGFISMNAETTLYIVVGGAGTGNTLGTLGTTLGGYNGGGNGNVINEDVFSGSGGGASHIALVNGELKTLEYYKDYNGILLTAAGGSGAYGYNPSSDHWWNGVSGGGIIGGYNNSSSQAGSQTSGYAFGAGGDQSGENVTIANTNHAGGGGGWYGGLADYADHNPGGLGAGSSNISNYYLGSYGGATKRMVGYGVTTSDTASTYTLTTSNHSATATEDYAKEGNGHVRITYIGTQ